MRLTFRLQTEADATILGCARLWEFSLQMNYTEDGADIADADIGGRPMFGKNMMQGDR